MSTFLIAILVSWGLLGAGSSSLIALVVGIALLDLGVQGAQISNQITVYRLRARGARSRLTTAYMVALLLGGVLGSLASASVYGGVLGSLASASVYGAAGWGATCALGAVIATVALATWAISERNGASLLSSPDASPR